MDRIIQEIENTFKCPNAQKDGPCRNDYQDDEYGKGVRVFTKKISANAGGTKCCTVCGKVS